MKSLHAFPHATRLMFGALAVVVLLVAVSAVAAVEPITSDQFAPGWQAHAQPMFIRGVTRTCRPRPLRGARHPAAGDYVLVARAAATRRT